MSALGSGRGLEEYDLGAAITITSLARAVEGRHRAGGHQVAIWILHPEVAGRAGMATRLTEAARRAALLRHPGIVATWDVITGEDDLGLVAEPPGGPFLVDLAAGSSTLPPATAMAIVDGLLGSLEALHGGGQLHGAISHEVIAVAASGQVRLDSVCLAQAVSADGAAGSPVAYLSPQRRRRGLVDAGADLYATAVLAHTLLAGRPPGDDGTVGSDVPAALGAVMARALASDPAARPATAAELRGAFLGAAFSALGPAWRLNADLAGRVAAAPRPAEAPPPERRPAAPPTQPATVARAPLTPPPGYLPPPAPRATQAPLAPPLLTPPPPRVSHRGRTAAIVLAALLLIAAAVVVTVLIANRSGSGSASGPLSVGSDVTVAVVRQDEGNCNVVYAITAAGSLTGSGRLVWHFEHRGQQPSPDSVNQIDGAPGFRFTTSIRLQGPQTGTDSVSFVVTSPTTRRVQKDFSIACP